VKAQIKQTTQQNAHQCEKTSPMTMLALLPNKNAVKTWTANR